MEKVKFISWKIVIKRMKITVGKGWKTLEMKDWSFYVSKFSW